MDKLHFIGIKENSLSESEREKLLLLSENTPGLVGVNVYSNLDCSDEEGIPVGIAMFMDTKHVVDPTLLSDRLFEVRAVSRVLKGPEDKVLDDSLFKGICSVEQHAADPPRPNMIDASGKEVEQWSPELGGPGSFVGSYYEADPEDHDVHTYYLAAQGTVPLLVQDFKQLVGEACPTYGELATKSQWTQKMQKLDYIARRNVCRNLVNLASDCGVSIRREMDLGVRNALDSPHQGMPQRAAPEVVQNTHTIGTCMYRGKHVVALYNGVVPSVHNQARGTFFIAASPSSGMYKFNLTRQSDMPAIPTSMRRNVLSPSPAAREGEKQKKLIQSRLQKVTWEGQGLPVHKDILPGAYQKIDSAFRSTMKQSGWDADAHAIQLLTPIQVKIYHPDIRR